MNILLLEDNMGIREAIASFLSLEDFNILQCETVKQTALIDFNSVDLFLLDIMLPDGNGYQLAKKIRENYETPIIFLTAKESESERIKGFEVGCDDYIVKPFSLKELSLRIQAILKRSTVIEKHQKQTYNIRNSVMEIDTDKHKLEIDGSAVLFTQTEWEILSYLIQYKDIVLSKERILESCLGYSRDSSERVIITHIKNIREKLGDNPWIETIRGFGYRFLGES